MSIGRRIRAARRERGWRQSDLAERAQITQASINRYENHGYEPTLRIAIKLAAALGMSLEELAKDEIAEEQRETLRETPKCVSRETNGGRET